MKHKTKSREIVRNAKGMAKRFLQMDKLILYTFVADVRVCAIFEYPILYSQLYSYVFLHFAFEMAYM